MAPVCSHLAKLSHGYNSSGISGSALLYIHKPLVYCAHLTLETGEIFLIAYLKRKATFY